MAELLSVAEAADELQLHPSRVRALAAAGSLPAIKIGKRWAIERPALFQRKPGLPGRPFAAKNAWAILFLASGQEVQWLDPSSHWRLRQVLAQHKLEELLPRLGQRADLQRFRAHPGELSYLHDNPALVRSGATAARQHRLKLVSSKEVDAYVRAGDFKRLAKEHVLQPGGRGDSNVILRVVADSAWHFGEHERYAPLAAVAVDLADEADPRAKRAAQDAFRRLIARLGGLDG